VVHDVGAAEWSLSSTSGYTRVRCCTEASLEGSFACRVHLDYEVPSEAGHTAAAEARPLVLSRQRLSELLTAVELWVAQSLRGLAANTFVHTVDLAQEPHDHFVLDFGPHTGLIIPTGGIGCRVAFGTSSFRTLVHFVTDVTCLDLFARGLERTLANN
jgi:hypothetical protein